MRGERARVGLRAFWCVVASLLLLGLGLVVRERRYCFSHPSAWDGGAPPAWWSAYWILEDSFTKGYQIRGADLSREQPGACCRSHHDQKSALHSTRLLQQRVAATCPSRLPDRRIHHADRASIRAFKIAGPGRAVHGLHTGPIRCIIANRHRVGLTGWNPRQAMASIEPCCMSATAPRAQSGTQGNSKQDIGSCAATLGHPCRHHVMFQMLVAVG